jgi:thiamine-phosphate pyrophosphorylase
VKLPDPPVLLVSDRKLAVRPLPQVLAEAVAGGCRWIMLREKDLPEEDLEQLLGEILAALAGAEVSVMVNRSAALAKRFDLAGVHLPADQSLQAVKESLGSVFLLGQSAHSLAAVLAAACQRADYVTLSPIFPSISKNDRRQSLGCDFLAATAAAASLPVVALGGITKDNAASCRRAGVAGIAVLGSVMGHPQPGAAMAELIEAWSEAG